MSTTIGAGAPIRPEDQTTESTQLATRLLYKPRVITRDLVRRGSRDVAVPPRQKIWCEVRAANIPVLNGGRCSGKRHTTHRKTEGRFSVSSAHISPEVATAERPSSTARIAPLRRAETRAIFPSRNALAPRSTAGEVLDVRQLHARCIIAVEIGREASGIGTYRVRQPLQIASGQTSPRRSGRVWCKLVDVGPVTGEDGSARLSDRGRHDSGP